MTITIILAQILGIIFTICGLSICVNKKGVASLIDETAHMPGLLWTLGFFILTTGSVVLVLNNTWTSGLVSLVSFIGWLWVLKGFLLLCCPKWSISIARKWINGGFLMLSGIIAFVIGLVLLYKGFM